MKHWIVLLAAGFLAGCEVIPAGSKDSVSAGQPDVRGTWYATGKAGGWGPRGDWGFSWLYIRQDGAEVRAAVDRELYGQAIPLDFDRYSGTLAGDHLVLAQADGSSVYDLTLSGDTLQGTFTTHTGGKSNATRFTCERVNTKLVRFADPDNPGVDWRKAR